MISVILLASGYSSRFGSNKLLHPVGDNLMYRHAVESAKKFQSRYGSEPVRLICVTAYEEINRELSERDGFKPWEDHDPGKSDKVQDTSRPLRLTTHRNLVVRNRNREKGISHSIALGIKAAEIPYRPADAAGEAGPAKRAPGENAWLFLVCDQPWLSHEDLQRLAEGFRRSGKTIGCMEYGGQTGNPVIFSGIYREELMGLTGDTGGKAVVRRHPGEVFYCPALHAASLKDIDYNECSREEDE